MATAQFEDRTDKITVFRYKSKTRQRRKTGSRKLYTRLSIDKILAPGMADGQVEKKPARKKKEVTESGT
jgi:hypothetical protein